ncbi:MAG: PD-(D/E)XK nuclease family protein [Anaerolineae bacterium]|nr:PD-(D/E)XK nuclease family protein [Anaerolineae bacterium]
MIANVFSHLSRFAASEENYLTEALVFVVRLLLERSTPLGLELVNLLCGAEHDTWFQDPTTVVISTQVATEIGIPDIEIRGVDTLVYIEVKHDSPLGAGQLEAYKMQLQRSGLANTRLVLLSRSKSSALGTTLPASEYHHLCWYQVYNWLAAADLRDKVCRYIADSLQGFLEEKRMSLKKVKWEYIEGIPAMLILTDMMEAALTEVLPKVKFTRTAGWSWRGFYLLEDYFFGVRYGLPLVIAFEGNKGNRPRKYERYLDLEACHFFALNKDEQFECIIEFLRQATAGAPKAIQELTAT